MERQPVRVAIVERHRVSTAAAPDVPRSAIFLRAALLAVLLAVAYRYSWLTLVRSPTASLVGGAVAALLAAAIVLRGRDPREPAIHDRYTDFIVGVPLLAGALAIVLLLPTRLSLFFWFWRLDLLSIPLFVGGALALLFGVRAFWRWRLVIATLFLIWLLRNAEWQSLPTLVSVAAGVIGAILTVARRGGEHRASRPRSEFGRPLVAAALVFISAAAATVASGSMDRFQPLLRDDGQPRFVRTSSTPALTGWTAYAIGSYDWIRRYASPDASWNRFAYSRAGFRPLLVDIISSGHRAPITDAGLSDLYRLHDHQLLSRRDVSLGDGVVGHAVTYIDATRAQWNAVYWDWPIQSGSGIRYERVVVNSDQSADGTAQTLIDVASRLIAGSTR
jgi:hypothetical protein